MIDNEDTSSRSLVLSDVKSQTEIYVQHLEPSTNKITEGQEQGKLLQDQTWTQIFDLKDSVLICNVEANELDLRLFHLTEQPLESYFAQMSRGKVRLSGSEPFLKTEDDQKEAIKSKFEKHKSCKVIAQGIIQKSLVLNPLQNPQSQESDIQNSTFGFDQIKPSNLSFPYQMYFVTVQGLLYILQLDKYFFENTENTKSIEVKKMIDLSPWVDFGVPKCMDFQFDYSSNESVIIIGTAVSDSNKQDPYNKDLNAQNMEQSLFVLRSNKLESLDEFDTSSNSMLFDRKQLGKANVSGLFKEITSTISRQLQQKYFSSSFTKKLDGSTAQGQEGFAKDHGSVNEGTIFVKALSNGLFASIYSNGILRIWSIYPDQCVAEYDLFYKKLEEKKQQPEVTISDLKKIVAAKITYYTSESVVENNQLSKSLTIAVAFQQQVMRTYKSRWSIDQLKVKFHNLSAQFEKEHEDLIDLGKSISIQQIFLKTLGENIEVTDLQYDKVTNQTTNQVNLNLWMSTFNKVDYESSITDLMQNTQIVWDKQSQMKLNEMYDRISLPDELQFFETSPYYQAVKTHYYKRIVERNRFSQIALSKNIHDHPQIYVNKMNRLSIKRTIQDVFDQGETNQLRAILHNCIQIEKKHSRISGMSTTLSKFPFRIIIRPLGLSIIKEDTQVSSIQKEIDHICIKLDQIKDQMTFENIRRVLNINSDSEILAPIIAALKFLHFSNLKILDDKIAKQPGDVLMNLKLIQREGYAYESLYQEICRIISNKNDVIQEQLNDLVDYLIYNKLQMHSQTGNEQGLQSSNLENIDQIEYNYGTQKFLERGLLDELKSQYELLRDISMLQVFLYENWPKVHLTSSEAQDDQQHFNIVIKWTLQTKALYQLLQRDVQEIDILNNSKQNKKKLKKQFNLLSSYEGTQQGSILQYLMLKDKHTFPYYQEQSFRGLNTFNDIFEELLKRVIESYTFRYPLQKQSYIPQVVRKLHSLQQWKDLLKYLHTINHDSVSFDFAKAYFCAKLGEDPNAFLKYINKCFAQFLCLEKSQDIIDFQQMVISRQLQSSKSLRTHRNFDIQFFVTVIDQLVGLYEMYVIYVIKYAFTNLQFHSQQDEDFLAEIMFQVSTSQNSIEQMYEGCSRIQSPEKRKNMIGQFFEKVFSQNSLEYLFTNCYFSDQNIDLALQYIYEKLLVILSKMKKDMKITDFSSKDFIQQIKLIHFIAQAYKKFPSVARFLYHLKCLLADQIGHELSKKNINEIQGQNRLKELLKVQKFALNIAYLSTLKCGDDFLITQQDLKMPKEKKRSRPRDSRVSESEEERKLHDFDYYLTYDLSLIDACRDEEFQVCKQGSMINQVFIETITQELLLTRARLKCLQYTSSNDISLLVKVLTEIGHHQLAIDLAIKFKTSIAYPFVRLLTSSNLQIDPMINGEKSIFQWRIQQVQACQTHDKDQMEQEFIGLRPNELDKLLHNNLQHFEDKDLIELLKGLIKSNCEIPYIIERELAKRNQIYQLVYLYLSQDSQDSDTDNFDLAFSLLMKYAPSSIADLISTDLNMLTLIMTNTEEILDALRSQHSTLKQERDRAAGQRQERQRQENQRLLNGFRSTQLQEQFTQDLDAFYAGSGQAYLDIVMESRDYHKEEAREDQQQQQKLSKLELEISQLATGLDKIKQVALNYLRD